MPLIKIITAAAFLLIVNLPAFADDSQPNLVSQVKFNISVLEANSDASMFLRSISLMNDGDVNDVKNFMEYRLDEFVCASWENLEKMNQAQKKWTTDALHKIKKHRETNPRVAGTVVDPEQFSKYLMPFDPSYAQRADEILASLQ